MAMEREGWERGCGGGVEKRGKFGEMREKKFGVVMRWWRSSVAAE
ncbi:hypothetical protein BVRB_7g158490 [Beta vulgaris subsp. vulgaris]|nr:hypothetical protein BVRB_7g158490 [Beta vulgaris subsp. vulgaris]